MELWAGESTEVDDNTTDIVLEAALFDPVAIRRSSRTQSLRSEASTRYERGVNQVELESACKRAISLLQELAGGTPKAQAVADNRVDFFSLPANRITSQSHQSLIRASPARRWFGLH